MWVHHLTPFPNLWGHWGQVIGCSPHHDQFPPLSWAQHQPTDHQKLPTLPLNLLSLQWNWLWNLHPLYLPSTLLHKHLGPQLQTLEYPLQQSSTLWIPQVWQLNSGETFGWQHHNMAPEFPMYECPWLPQIALSTWLDLLYILYHLAYQGLILKPSQGWFCERWVQVECSNTSKFGKISRGREPGHSSSGCKEWNSLVLKVQSGLVFWCSRALTITITSLPFYQKSKGPDHKKAADHSL